MTSWKFYKPLSALHDEFKLSCASKVWRECERANSSWKVNTHERERKATVIEVGSIASVTKTRVRCLAQC